MSYLTNWLRVLGLDPRRAYQAVNGIGRDMRDRRQFLRTMGNDFTWGSEFPVIGEWADTSGRLGAYFHQDLLVARWIYNECPQRHIDVGSRLDGFIGHLAVFREVEVLDIRAQPEVVPNVICKQFDLMQELPAELREATDSLSCLHTIEHFGLGRYGDTVDPDGYHKGLRQLKRMVKPGGVLYLSTPMGPQRVEFNAHRVFSAATILGWFDREWLIEKFAVINDFDIVIQVPLPSRESVEANFGCNLGVGIVAARKI